MRKMKNKSAASMLKITLVALLMVPTILAIPTSEPAFASPMINVSSGALTPPPPPEHPSIRLLTLENLDISIKRSVQLFLGVDYRLSSIPRP